MTVKIQFILFAVIFIASFVYGQQHVCRQKYEKVGCFRDRVVPDRPLTIQLLNRMDKYSKKWDGKIMDWKHYSETLYQLACKCAELTLARGYTYFGIEFFGECWTGPDTQKYDRDGASTDCVGSKFEACSKTSPAAECAGRCFSNYIYKVHKPIDGRWGDWSKWSKCTGPCGTNKAAEKRNRKCNKPLPAHGGKPCSGKPFEIKPCTIPCVVWTSWSSWARCTTTRQRKCVIQGTKTPSDSCPGDAKDTKYCEDCKSEWGRWTSWGSCSAPSCGNGARTRVRLCFPIARPIKCKGPRSEKKKCGHICTK